MMRMGHDSPFPLHSPHHSLFNTSDLESRLMTACNVKFPQIEIPPSLEVPCDRAGSNRSQWRGLHFPQVLTSLRHLKQLSITTAFQIARLNQPGLSRRPIPSLAVSITPKNRLPTKNANSLAFFKNLIYVRGAWWREGSG